jgi:hypothetical protein
MPEYYNACFTDGQHLRAPTANHLALEQLFEIISVCLIFLFSSLLISEPTPTCLGIKGLVVVVVLISECNLIVILTDAKRHSCCDCCYRECGKCRFAGS